MYICSAYGCEFETPKTIINTYGFETPPYEEIEVCPYCGSEDYSVSGKCISCTETIAECDLEYDLCKDCISDLKRRFVEIIEDSFNEDEIDSLCNIYEIEEI